MITEDDAPPRTVGFQRVMLRITSTFAVGGIPTGLIFAFWQERSGWFLVGLAFSALSVVGYCQVRAVDGRTMLEHAIEWADRER